MDCVCLQLVVSVELLVSTVQLTASCFQSSPVSASPAPASVARLAVVYDVRTNLTQIVQQLARDIDVFWQVTLTYE